MSSTLGRSARKRDYDIPLNNDSGVKFLVILIGLMCFLAILSVVAGATLSAISKHWTSGLENRMTVEIPAKDFFGSLIPPEEILIKSKMIANELSKLSTIRNAEALSSNDIKELVSPWLGKNKELPASIPLPGLVSIEVNGEISKTDFDIITKKVTAIAPTAKIDKHEEWLSDLLRFTNALKFASLILMITIAFTTIIAVAGAIKSRMSVNHDELELLHLMGARDSYIIKQFQRHGFIIGVKGVIVGIVLAGVIIPILGFMAGKLEISLVPDFSFLTGDIALIIATPVIMLIIVVFTARITCKKVLRDII